MLLITLLWNLLKVDCPYFVSLYVGCLKVMFRVLL